MTDTLHPNLAVMNRLDITNLDSCADAFADDFVWHYENPKLPDLHGDHHGVSGLARFFSALSEISSGTFQVNPVEVRPVGDELVFVHACNQLSSEATDNELIEFDAIVIWRIINGQITEAWDIPAVHTARTIHQSECS